jgi:hypothetical protein
MSKDRFEDENEKGSKTILCLLLIAVVLFAVEIIQTIVDDSNVPRLIVSGGLALDLIVTFAIASWGERLCRFASLLLIAAAPAAPFAIAAYGYGFWLGIPAGVALLALGTVAYLWLCYTPPQGGVK